MSNKKQENIRNLLNSDNQENANPLTPEETTAGVTVIRPDNFNITFGGQLANIVNTTSTREKNKQVQKEKKLNENTLQWEDVEIFLWPSLDGQIAFFTASDMNTNTLTKALKLKGDTKTLFILLYWTRLAENNSNKAKEKAETPNDINYQINLDINETMDLYGKTNRKDFRKMIKSALEQLENLKFKTLKIKSGGYLDYTQEPARYNIISSIVPTRNGYKITLNPDLAYMIVKNNPVFKLSKTFYRISENNPIAKQLTFKLNNYYSQYENQLNGTHNIISVKSLLNDLGESLLPSYETVMQKKGQVTQRIIDPFEKALNAIEEVSPDEQPFKWEYCKSKKVPYTDEELENWDYGKFINSYIHFEFGDIPTLTDEEIKEIKAKRARNKQIREDAKARRKAEKEAENG